MENEASWMIIIQTVITTLSFFVQRAIVKADAKDIEINKLREEMGRQKMINEAIWRQLDAAKKPQTEDSK